MQWKRVHVVLAATRARRTVYNGRSEGHLRCPCAVLLCCAVQCLFFDRLYAVRSLRSGEFELLRVRLCRCYSQPFSSDLCVLRLFFDSVSPLLVLLLPLLLAVACALCFPVWFVPCVAVAV